VLLVSPTGSGKTVMFCWLAAEAALRRGKRIAILVHRQELVDQTSVALGGMGIAHGVIAAGQRATEAAVQISSTMTLVRRLGRGHQFDLVVIDEAHHAVAGTWRRILDAFQEAFVLGVTATPERLDGRGLGDIFEETVIGPSVADLVEAGFLCPATTYAWCPPDLSGVRTRAGDYATDDLSRIMSGATIVGDAVAHYAELCTGQPALAYCCSLDHSRLVAERFRQAGFRAAHVDGETPEDVRRATVAALGNGNLDVVTNCYLFTEGVDVPVLGAVILLRPTKSLGLYLQMVGRALRPAPGKKRALILDHAGNVWRHGLCDDAHRWSLDSKKRKSGVAPVKHCSSCEAIVPLGCRTCPECGFSFAAAARQRSETEGGLLEITAEDRLRRMPYRDLLAWARGDFARLHMAATARGYRPGWVWYQLQHFRGAA
jgi:DNA repair protein RadD